MKEQMSNRGQDVQGRMLCGVQVDPQGGSYAAWKQQYGIVDTMEKGHRKQVCQNTKTNFTLITSPVLGVSLELARK